MSYYNERSNLIKRNVTLTDTAIIEECKRRVVRSLPGTINNIDDFLFIIGYLFKGTHENYSFYLNYSIPKLKGYFGLFRDLYEIF